MFLQEGISKTNDTKEACQVKDFPKDWSWQKKIFQLYFEDHEKEVLYPVSKYNTLLEVLQHKRYFALFVDGGNT